jgi:hypothetical protein
MKQSTQPLADRSARQGGLSAMGRADRPAGYRGLSAPLPQTVRPEPRTVR